VPPEADEDAMTETTGRHTENGVPPFRYTAELAGEIELRWQDRWESEGIFAAPNPAGPLAEPEKVVAGRPKKFVLDMFPYPSGAGLHVGHPLGYLGTDVYARFLRMTGHNVLHAFGYDAFGLPAEQYAVQTGQHPRVTTYATSPSCVASCGGWAWDTTIAAASPRPVDAVAAYREAVQGKTDVERQTEGRVKTGVFTGAYAVNPANGEHIPVFVADYVLMGYGTGAIMAVPGQDERDWEFAERFDLPIVRTVQPPADWAGEAYSGEGPAINSANDEVSLDGLGVAEAKQTITDWLEQRGVGTRTVTFKLRDWLFSRQRY
jgi:leucyl-tRNA synthetase